MFVSFPHKGGPVAVNVDHIQRIVTVEGYPDLSRVLFSVLADGSTESVTVRLPFHEAVALVNQAVADERQRT